MVLLLIKIVEIEVDDRIAKSIVLTAKYYQQHLSNRVRVEVLVNNDLELLKYKDVCSGITIYNVNKIS